MLVATFGQNVKRIREAQRVTQEVLAARLGLKRSAQISLMESSEALPKPDTIVRFAEALHVKPSLLLEDVETEYDRLRENKPLHRRIVVRKMAVGESPPRPRYPVRGKRANP